VQPPLSSVLSDPFVLVVALAVLAGAFLVGLLVGRSRSRRDAERARELEDRLQLAEDEMNRYRADVAEHFSQTSTLLRDLTLQYRTVYEHLAEGARSLCPEAGTLLPTSLAEAALPAAASEAPRGNGAAHEDEAAPVDDAQLDLALDRAEDYARAEAAREDLGPLLDERIEGLDEAPPAETPRA
jgi:uncharacterized membrane-anchored protein YhcB (DUF1043 family)